MKYTKLFLLIALISVVFITGCTQTTTSEQQDLTYNPPVGAIPDIEIISPIQGEEISSSAVGIRVNVTNFRLADIISKPLNRQNEGHIYYNLDGREQQTPMKIVSYTNVAKGFHTLRVQLLNNDGSPVLPLVTKSVTFITV